MPAGGFLFRLHDLGFDLHKTLQPGNSKQLDRQIKLMLPVVAGSTQKAQILCAGEFRGQRGVRSRQMMHNEVIPTSPAEIVVGL